MTREKPVGARARRVALVAFLSSVTIASVSASPIACSSTAEPEDGGGSNDDVPSTAEHEPTVAVTAGGRVLVTWIAAIGTRENGRPRRVIRYHVSEDRGTTFGAVGSIPVAEYENGGNSWAAAGPGETLYIASGAAYRSTADVLQNVRLLLSMSAAPGEPFTTTDVTPPGGPQARDQPRVEVVGDRVFYSHWSLGISHSARIGRVTNGAVERWSALPSSGNLRVCRSTGGPLYAVVSDQSDGTTLYRSDDGGDAWRTSLVLSTVPGVPTPSGCVASEAGVHVVVPNTSPLLNSLGGTLFFVDGASETIAWQAELPAKAWLPDITVLDGRASVFGYLEAEGGQGTLGRRVIGRKGEIESPWIDLVSDLQVSGPVFDGDAARFTPPWPGDYLGVATADNRSWVAFTDNHDGVAHVELLPVTP